MNKSLALLCLSLFLSLPALAGEVQGELCFPETAEEIVRLRQTGECAGTTTRGIRQTKGLGGQAGQSKGISVAPDRAGALVQFDYGSAGVKPESFALLNEWATALKDLGQSVVVAGHADYIGGEEYNQALSLRRAQAVARYLNGQGVPMPSLLIQAYGESQPLRGTTVYQSDEDREWNRRVEFRWANP